MPHVRRRSASRFALAIIAAAASMSPASAQGPIDDPPEPEITFPGCRYYLHDNYDGASEDISDGVNRRYVGDRWNDQISSIACHDDCAMTVYEHFGYAGVQRRIVDSVAAVGPEWNDRISSMRVSCRAAEDDPPIPAPEPEDEPEPEQQVDMEPSR